MSTFRLYRKVYRVNYNSGTPIYTLVNPVSISASVYLSNTIVESVSVVNDSTGVYYVELTPSLYTNPNIYELRWTIQYTSDSASSKTLQTMFMYEPANVDNRKLYVFGEISYELEDSAISFEVQEQTEIITEVINNQ